MYTKWCIPNGWTLPSDEAPSVVYTSKGCVSLSVVELAVGGSATNGASLYRGIYPPRKGKSLGVKILSQCLLALGQVGHQGQQLLRQTLHVGRLHHVGRLGHLHHEHLELGVHDVKPLLVLGQLDADILGAHEDGL